MGLFTGDVLVQTRDLIQQLNNPEYKEPSTWSLPAHKEQLKRLDVQVVAILDNLKRLHAEGKDDTDATSEVTRLGSDLKVLLDHALADAGKLTDRDAKDRIMAKMQSLHQQLLFFLNKELKQEWPKNVYEKYYVLERSQECLCRYIGREEFTQMLRTKQTQQGEASVVERFHELKRSIAGSAYSRTDWHVASSLQNNYYRIYNCLLRWRPKQQSFAIELVTKNLGIESDRWDPEDVLLEEFDFLRKTIRKHTNMFSAPDTVSQDAEIIARNIHEEIAKKSHPDVLSNAETDTFVQSILKQTLTVKETMRYLQFIYDKMRQYLATYSHGYEGGSMNAYELCVFFPTTIQAGKRDISATHHARYYWTHLRTGCPIKDAVLGVMVIHNIGHFKRDMIDLMLEETKDDHESRFVMYDMKGQVVWPE